jgi:hypothetical protein
MSDRLRYGASHGMPGQQKPPDAEVVGKRHDIVRHIFDREGAAMIICPASTAVVDRDDGVFGRQRPHHQTPDGMGRSEARHEDQHLVRIAVAPVMQWRRVFAYGGRAQCLISLPAARCFLKRCEWSGSCVSTTLRGI